MKKKIEMPKIKATAVELINKKTKFYTVVAAIGVIVILCVGFLARKETNLQYVQKNVVNDYACQVVDFDEENGMIAFRCLTK